MLPAPLDAKVSWPGFAWQVRSILGRFHGQRRVDNDKKRPLRKLNDRCDVIDGIEAELERLGFTA
jgi:hypothetical protein